MVMAINATKTISEKECKTNNFVAKKQCTTPKTQQHQTISILLSPFFFDIATLMALGPSHQMVAVVEVDLDNNIPL